ncbi:PGF-CTERM-anchored ABC transporter substrate-binding protein [Halobaculum sp. D14]|uniref:PGF-CTERM-anchored ABC transporter substrate-binding protein n=1 Tax=unclassified Halobaculum TaxID=2640896 RepID=UPI003EBA522D
MRQFTAILVTAAVLLAGVAPAAGAAGAAGTAAGAAPAGTDAPLQQSGGAAQCSFPFTATDATGTEVTVEEKPERVTTLAPSAAQTMWEIGGKSQVVGVSRHATYLDGAESRTNVSAGFSVSVEAVVGTNPDLVLAPNVIPTDTVTALRNAGLKVFYMSAATSVADVRNKTTLIGRLTGNCRGAAEANAWMTANVDAAAQATADVEPVRALYPLGGGYVANTGTFISAMMRASGAENVVAEANVSKLYPQLSSEVILQLQPDWLVLSSGSSYLLSQEPYASTPAVQNNNTVTVNANYLNQPAPRSVVMAVRTMTKAFHPEAAASAEFETRAEVEASMSTPTPEPTTAASTTATTDSPAESTATTGAGFGFAVAALSVAVAALLARRR